MQVKWSGTLLVGMLVMCAPATVMAQQVAHRIGTLVTIQGAVTARAVSGETRTLQSRSQLYAGETVVVAAKGYASIRMIDNAHLSLGPSTEFSFDTYRYDANPATPDHVVMSLVRGCFRTVVGSAGSAKRDTYRIDTPVAIISVDGAFHGAAMVGDRLYTASWDGETVVDNTAGSISLGKYGDFSFSRTYPGSAPEGLSGQLPVLACEPPHSLDLENLN